MTRAFHTGFGMPWTDAFSVRSRAELESVLAGEGMWLPGDSLRTVRCRPGVVDHPVTGEECWFNQLAFLNSASLDPRELAILTEEFGRHLIPVDTAFGDGAPLSFADLSAIQHVQGRLTRPVEWRRGDLLVVDNVLTAQGCAAFTGNPEFLVAFGGASPVPEGTVGDGR